MYNPGKIGRYVDLGKLVLEICSASKPKDELTISGNDGDDAKKYQVLDVKNILKKLREVQGK